MTSIPAQPDPALPPAPGLVDVVAGILWRDKRFLAVQRPQGKPLAGYWEFPGGKVEPGEGLLAALARELREELDIGVQTAELWREKEHQYDHLAVKLHFFQVQEFSGTPASREGQVLAWLAPKDALGYPFLPADLEIVRNLIRRPQTPTINQ